MREGLVEFKHFCKLNKRKIKCGVYNLRENESNVAAIEEWGMNQNTFPQVAYLDGTRPINSKYRRFFRPNLVDFSEFNQFKMEVEAKEVKHYLNSEEPELNDEGKIMFFEDSKHTGWTKLTGKSYKKYVKNASTNIVMWYMNNEDYRSNNLKKQMEPVLEKLRVSGEFRFVTALIDCEKNEIENYKYARTPYLSVIRQVDGKKREFKAVHVDNEASIQRFLESKLDRYMVDAEDIIEPNEEFISKVDL